MIFCECGEMLKLKKGTIACKCGMVIEIANISAPKDPDPGPGNMFRRAVAFFVLLVVLAVVSQICHLPVFGS